MTQKEVVTYGRIRLTDRLAAGCIFAVALLTYWLTLEPTASFWDCPEYIAVADKMQVGHSPGNPIWMLAARFFINFAADAAHKALMVNAMSGLFTALAAMMCYLSITLLANIAHYGSADSLRSRGMSAARLTATTGAGCAGALAFTWSDSVWFSAVEAEVYAFSIFLTALTFWTVLRWSFAHRDKPHGDRWLILAAYLTGTGMGVHELNLLCLPALSLIVWYGVRHKKGAFASWVALFTGCAAVGFILFGCIPGFFAFAKSLELWMVNRMHLPFNSGFLAAWLTVFLILAGALAWLTLSRRKGKTIRIATISAWCAMMFFIGFSSYALIVIRGTANPPLNTGTPGNVFAFSSYYAREQYGSAPLFYGPAFGAQRLRIETTDSNGDKSYHRFYNTDPTPHYMAGRHGDKALLRNGFATSADSMQALADSRRQGDFYIMTDHDFTSVRTPEMNMWFPRMYSGSADDIKGYYNWSGMRRGDMKKITRPTQAVDASGNPVKNPELPADTLCRPSYLHNFSYLGAYQLGFMYGRYFLWNFVGRQNDIPGHGEPDCGLPVSGIEHIDKLWCGPSDTMPAESGRDNPGRNIYWFLPLALGLAGAIWQMKQGGGGRRGASAVFALFFFTGVAIVLYLNQPPVQARDRDYAFLGSYYAFCLWIGLGVMLLWDLSRRMSRRHAMWGAIAAVAAGAAVPLQMLSQTADDHDRSRRTATTDLAFNIMAPLPQGAVIFVEGDNSTFPLWYLQSVEEVRRDVRIVCLSYLADPEYAASLQSALWEAPPLAMTMPLNHLHTGRYAYASLPSDTTWRDASDVLKRFYATQSDKGFPALGASRVYIPFATDTLRIDLRKCTSEKGMVRQELLTLLDIIATSASRGGHTPLYWVSADGDGIFHGTLLDYMRHEGPVMRLSPGDTAPQSLKVLADADNTYRWGGADLDNPPYYDPLTARRMAMFRRSLVEHASHLSLNPATSGEALRLIDIIRRKMPPKAIDYTPYMLPDSIHTDEGTELGLALWRIGEARGSRRLREEGLRILKERLDVARGWEGYSRSLPEDWRRFISIEHQGYILEAPRLRSLTDSLSGL